MTSVGPAVQGKAGACTWGAGHSQRHKVPAIQRSPASSEATGQSVDAIHRRCHQIISTRRRAPHMRTFTPNCPAEDHRTQTPQRHAPQLQRSTSARTALSRWMSLLHAADVRTQLLLLWAAEVSPFSGQMDSLEQ